MTPKFFRSQSAFRKWLETHHDKESELVVGFYRASSGRGGITYKEALDEALCFGWIDGVRRTIDAASYSIRFTPRRRNSYWSAVNTARFRELMKLGVVAPPGRKAFEARDANVTAKYSFERDSAKLDPVMEKAFRANKKAWTFFNDQPPFYRRTLTWWVVSAKKPETRTKRLQALISACESERRIL